MDSGITGFFYDPNLSIPPFAPDLRGSVPETSRCKPIIKKGYTSYLLFNDRLYQNGNDPRKPNEGKITLLYLWTRALAKVEMKQFTKFCSNATELVNAKSK